MPDSGQVVPPATDQHENANPDAPAEDDGTQLSEEVRLLLKNWRPGQPVPGGTFVTGLGTRARGRHNGAAQPDEQELGL